MIPITVEPWLRMSYSTEVEADRCTASLCYENEEDLCNGVTDWIFRYYDKGPFSLTLFGLEDTKYSPLDAFFMPVRLHYACLLFVQISALITWTYGPFSDFSCQSIEVHI